MKRLCMLLCLLNVLLFFWEWRSGRSTSEMTARKSLPGILLLSEYQTARRGAEISAYLDQYAADMKANALAQLPLPAVDQSKAVMPNTITPLPKKEKVAVAIAPECFRFGPFADQPALQTWLEGKSLPTPDLQNDEISEVGDYQVYFPPAKDEAQLRSNKIMLANQGYPDVWPLTQSELQRGLSLGVFKERARAAQFQEQLRKQGIKAEITERRKRRSVIYAEFRLDREQYNVLSLGAVSHGRCAIH